MGLCNRQGDITYCMMYNIGNNPHSNLVRFHRLNQTSTFYVENPFKGAKIKHPNKSKEEKRWQEAEGKKSEERGRGYLVGE